MTTETKMPDVIYAGEVILRGECIGLWNDTDVEGGIKYHHDDIHQAVVAERDALKALCEQMAGALGKTRTLVSAGAEQGFNYQLGNWTEPLFENNGDITAALTAYEKHKGADDDQR